MKIDPEVYLYDKSVATENIRFYQISILLSQDGFSYTIYDTLTNCFLALVSYKLAQVSEINQISILQSIVEQDQWLCPDYNKITLLYSNTKSTLVPAPLYDDAKNDEYLQLTNDLNDNHIILKDYLKLSGSYNVYSFPVQLFEYMQVTFPELQIIHFKSPLIECFLSRFKNTYSDEVMLLQIHRQFIDLVVMKNDKLMFSNSFEYQTPEDLVYYTLFALEQLGLNPQKLPVKVAGILKKESKTWDWLRKYIKDVEFIERNDEFSYSDELDSMPHYYFYNLLNWNLCEL